MSYSLEVIRDKPVGLWMMDDSSPFQDYSGYNRNGSATGTVVTSIPLAAGAVYSSVLNKDIIASFDSPVFQQGKEGKPFSLESWVYPIVQTQGYAVQTYRENLIFNPSFETSLSGLTNYGASVSRTRDSTRSFVGAYSTKITANSPGIQGQYFTAIPVTPGKTYTFSVYVYSIADIVRLNYWFKDETGTNVIGTQTPTPTHIPGTNWQIISWTATAPQTAVSVEPRVYINASVANNEFWFDAVMFEESQQINSYFDGSFPGYEWSGAANNSVSRSRTDVSRVNLFNNPSFGASESSIYPVIINGAPNAGTVSYTKAYVGSKSAYIQPATENWGYVPGLSPATGIIKYGGWYVISCYVNSDSTQDLTLIDYGDQNRAGPTVTCPAGVWTRLSLNINVTNQQNIFLSVRRPGRVGTATSFYLDAFMIERGTTLGNYFDGDSIGAEWSGVAQSSQSVILVSESEQQILGNKNQLDGLIINDTKVAFTTKYLNTGECRAEYDLQIPRAVHAVGVHSSDKNSLYIDGTLVAEVAVTEAQRADSFVASDGKLYSGQTDSSKNIAVNGIGIYPAALSAESVSRHFAAGRDNVGADTPTLFGGVVIPVSKNMSDVLTERRWASASDWGGAVLKGVVIDKQRLMPMLLNGISVPGAWLDSCDLYDADTPTAINSINMMWDGEGATVEASVDNVTWEVAERGKNLAIIPAGFDPSNKELYVRVSFPGGIENDQSYMDNLTVTVFKTGQALTSENRTVTYTQPAYVKNDYSPVEQRDDWGVELNGGGLEISEDTSADPMIPKTVEIWLKRTTEDAASFSGNLSTAQTFYSNGIPGVSYLTGQWTIRHFVLDSGFSTPISISGNVQIGRVVLYEDALTADQIATLYESYTGTPTERVGDNSIVAVAESPTAANIYAHDWSIEQSG